METASVAAASAASNTHIQNNVFCVEVPEEIPDDAKQIPNDSYNEAYWRNLKGENISFFIHNGRIYIHYETMDGVRIWQSVEIPHGWNVREDFQFMRYNWINQDDRDIPQNLRILVFFDRGFLKLTFSSNWDDDENLDKNFVRLEDIAVFPYSSMLDGMHEKTTIHQYAWENTVLFASALQFDNKFVLTFEQIYFNKKFERYVCKVVLPLSKDVVVEYLRDNLNPNSLFFDYYGNRTEPNIDCCLEATATISGESFLVELILNPQSVQQHFTDDGTDGLGLYRRRTDQNFNSFDCIKSSESGLVGFFNFQNSELAAARLLEIFPVNQIYAKMYSDAAKRLTSFMKMSLVRDRTIEMRLEQTQSFTDCSICMESKPNLFIFSCGHVLIV